MDERSQRIERRLEPLVLVAAVLVIPVLVLEDGNYGAPWDSIGVALNWATWLAFLAETAVMLSVVPNRRDWLRQHPIDVTVVVLTPPFLAFFAPVRLLRLLRLLRLFRLAPLVRRLVSAEGLRSTALLALLTAVAGGAAFAEVERNRSTGEGVYWALTTMTTVGYGDLSPKTAAGRAIALVVMLVGIGFVAILTGAIAQRFVARDVEEEAEHVEEQLDEASTAILAELRALQARLAGLEAAIQRRAR
jgi:voltage-gated potassium channel